MGIRRKPAISVVIATYNWSAALRCALRSVLLQTMQDFEILVVGDGCSDDSEQVVAEFNDARIRWHNLERNHGSQWAANNWGVAHAAADWIAYLGHDDIWYPTHLAAVLRAAQRKAQVVTSTMILYWPPQTGGRSIAGIFPRGVFQPGQFVPPSALAHVKDAAGAPLRWRDASALEVPVDVAFLDDLAARGLRFATTSELTCFKFNAAWRRDAYRVKSVDEQQRLLQRIEAGADFRQAELLGVLQAIVAGRFMAVSAPEATQETLNTLRRNRQRKGLASRFEPASLLRVDQPLSFDMTGQDAPFEWHALEFDANANSFRWTGPSTRATIDLPIVFDRDLAIRIEVIGTLRPDLIRRVRLAIQEHPLKVRRRVNGAAFLLDAKVRRVDVAASTRDFGLTIDTHAVTRPCDLQINDDRRWLGLAVSRIEVAPWGPRRTPIQQEDST